MNKKGQNIPVGMIVIILVILLFFVVLPWVFKTVTVTYVELSIINGKISGEKIIEGTTARLNTWGGNYDSGYYTIRIADKSGANILKEIKNTGSLKKSIFINEYVTCVYIGVYDATNNSTLLDSKIICKNEQT